MASVGVKDSTHYLSSADPVASNVMTHQRNNNNSTSNRRQLIPRRRTEVKLCQVIDCGGVKESTCRVKNCGKQVCSLHGKGHDKHKHILNWKEVVLATTNTTLNVEPSSLADPIIDAVPTVVAANVEVVRCRVGLCNSDATWTCEDCGIEICPAHGKEHSKHEFLHILNIERI